MKTAINVTTQAEYDAMMAYCQVSGYKWVNGGKFFDNRFPRYKDHTCIFIAQGGVIWYGDITSFKKSRYRVITFSEFVKQNEEVKA